MVEMDWMLFAYYLGNLLMRLLLILSAVNLLVCGNVLLLGLTFSLLRKRKKEKPITTYPTETKATFLNMETGKQEKWAQKNIWVKED